MGNCLGGSSYSYVNKVSSTARPGESSPLLLALLSLCILLRHADRRCMLVACSLVLRSNLKVGARGQNYFIHKHCKNGGSACHGVIISQPHLFAASCETN